MSSDFEDGTQGFWDRLLRFFKPHKTIPALPWSAAHQWEFGVKRICVLIIGLVLFGIGDAFIIASNLGNAPWSVLAQGLALTFEASIGLMTFLVGLTVLLLWIPLKRRVGLGTVLNVVFISASIEVTLRVLPRPSALVGIGYVLIGVILVGLGSALYLTCGLGAGPRDGLMTGLHEWSGIRIGRIRLVLELVVLVIGFLLGGTVGLGTALFALLIGQSVAIWLGVVSRSTSR